MVKMRSDVPERQLSRTFLKANKVVCGGKIVQIIFQLILIFDLNLKK